MNTNQLIELSKLYIERDINTIKEKEVYVLQSIIDNHNNLYYNSDSPVISDFEYDILFKKLSEVEKKYSV